MEQQCAASTSQDKLTKVAILHHQVNPYFFTVTLFPANSYKRDFECITIKQFQLML